MQRVSVVGNSGSGKTTTARELASVLGVPHVELDAIFHQPGWQELPRDEFRRRVQHEVSAPGWVIDGNYSAVRDIVWDAADTVVWMDPPHPLVMARVIRRTLRRVVTREELWNGNREPWSNLFRSESIVVWAWTQRHKYQSRYAAAMTAPELGGVRFIRVRTAPDRRRLMSEAGGLRAARPAEDDRGARAPGRPG